MKLKTYSLTIQWPNRATNVQKQFKTKRDSEKWAQNCLAICGKNELGENFTSYELKEVKTEKQTAQFQFEYTDTFGGEANYSWVRRKDVTFSADISDRALVCRAKAWAGLSGHPCRTENMGDLIAIYPQGSCTVLFIQTIY